MLFWQYNFLFLLPHEPQVRFLRIDNKIVSEVKKKWLRNRPVKRKERKWNFRRKSLKILEMQYSDSAYL